jgi:proteasome lid subunit RPN8/RPN11
VRKTLADDRVILTPTAHRALEPLVALGRSGMERVAFLHGSTRDRRILIDGVRQVANTHRRPGGFGVSMSEYRKAVASGTLVGLFHTHTRDCRPSSADIALLRRSRLLQIIGAPGTSRGAIRLESFHWVANDRIDSLPIEVSCP